MAKASEPSNGRLGILAGKGEIPYLAARTALAAGEDIRIFNFTDEPVPSDLASYSRPVVLTQMFKSVMGTMKKEKVDRLLLLGKASKDVLYQNPKFDLKTVYLLAKMVNQNDTTIFLTLAKEFEKQGIHIIPQTDYLGEMFLAPGRYGKKCSDNELADIEFGTYYAMEMNRLDIGQTVVVGSRAVLAVECVEGSDECIKRGGGLFRGKGAVVCKVAKRNHDTRFDVPVTGGSTLVSLKESGCRVLAIESAQTFVLKPHEFVKQAKGFGITVVALDPSNSKKAVLKKLNARESNV